MKGIKGELVDLLNQALKLEHAARIQYLAHAELITGLNAEPIIKRLQEIAGDEAKHEGMFRDLIGNYLFGEPTMDLAATYQAKDIQKILEVNLKGEKEAIDFYKQIYKKIIDNKDHADLRYIFETLEHVVRHIIIEEEEHIAELSILLGL